MDGYISTRHSHWWTFIVLFLVSPCLVLTQNSDATISPTQETLEDNEPGPLKTPLEKSLNPVYAMTNFFMETVIQPLSIVSLNKHVNLSDFDAVLESFQSDWQFWIKHYTGYLACWVVAVIYVLGLPLAGCIFCGCRSRGRCGGKQSDTDKKNTGHKRRGCAFLLTLVFVCLLLGITVMFVATDLVHKETEHDRLPTTISGGVSRIDHFKNLALDSYSAYFDTLVHTEIQDVLDTVSNIPDSVQQGVGKVTQTGPLLNTITTYVGEINSTIESLRSLKPLASTVVAKVTELETVLNQLKSNITRDFTGCSATSIDCANIINTTAALDILIDYTNVPDMTLFADAFVDLITGSDPIYSGLTAAQAEFNQISQVITSVSGNTISTLFDEVNKVSSEAEQFQKDAKEAFDTISLVDATTFINETLNPKIKEYGNYWYYAGLAISSFVLLIVVICSLGLLFGACGERAGIGNHCCNKGTASKLLWFSLIMVMVFGWILMLLTAVMMPVGGIAHNDVCRNLQDPRDKETIQVIDDFISDVFNVSYKFHDMYGRCERGEALYSALQLQLWGSQYDLTQILDPEKYNVRNNLDQLLSVNYNPGNLVLMNTPLASKLEDSQANTEQILVDLSEYSHQTAQPITSESFQNLAMILRSAVDKNNGMSTLFQYYLDTVERIQNNEYIAVQTSVNLLKSNVNKVNKFTQDFNMTVTSHELTKSQVLITNNTILAEMNTTTSALYTDYVDLLSDVDAVVRTQLAQCETISNVITENLDGICERLFYPFNSFWFSLGWCLFFFIFLFPIVVVLSDYYKKTQKYEKDLQVEQPSSRERRGSSESGIGYTQSGQESRPQQYLSGNGSSHVPSSDPYYGQSHVQVHAPHTARDGGHDTRNNRQASTQGNYFDNKAYTEDYSQPINGWDTPVDRYYSDDVTRQRQAGYHSGDTSQYYTGYSAYPNGTRDNRGFRY